MPHSHWHSEVAVWTTCYVRFGASFAIIISGSAFNYVSKVVVEASCWGFCWRLVLTPCSTRGTTPSKWNDLKAGSSRDVVQRIAHTHSLHAGGQFSSANWRRPDSQRISWITPTVHVSHCLGSSQSMSLSLCLSLPLVWSVVRLSVCPSLRPSVRPSIHRLSIRLPVCPSVRPSVSLSLSLSLSLLCVSVRLSLSLSISPLCGCARAGVCVCVCVFVSLSLSLSQWLHFSVSPCLWIGHLSSLKSFLMLHAVHISKQYGSTLQICTQGKCVCRWQLQKSCLIHANRGIDQHLCGEGRCHWAAQCCRSSEFTFIHQHSSKHNSRRPSFTELPVVIAFSFKQFLSANLGAEGRFGILKCRFGGYRCGFSEKVEK